MRCSPQLLAKPLPQNSSSSSQECRLHKLLLEQLQILPGMPVLVFSQGACHLCTGWPDTSGTQNFLWAAYDQRVEVARTGYWADNIQGQVVSPGSVAVVPAVAEGCSVLTASSLLLVCSYEGDEALELEEPACTAMIKHAIRGACITQGCTVQVVLGKAKRVSAQVSRATPSPGNNRPPTGGSSTGLPQVWRVTSATTILVERAPPSAPPLCLQPWQAPQASSSSVQAALMELILWPLQAGASSNTVTQLVPRGLLLSGPPGVGKTFAVEQAIKACSSVSGARVKLLKLDGGELMGLGMGDGQDELCRIFKAAHKYSMPPSHCSVIFLDEMDALFSPGDTGRGVLLTQLLTLLDGFSGSSGKGHVIVVGSTNRAHAIDRALRRPGRFDREIAVGAPSVAERLSVLEHQCRRVPVRDKHECLGRVAEAAVGYVGADLAALVREAALEAVRREEVQVGDGDGMVEQGDFETAMEKVGASSLRGQQVSVPSTSWADIGGMEEAKEALKRAVEWPATRKAALNRFHLDPPRGILLHGPPGCSKTTLVRAASCAAASSFVSMSGADVFSPLLGEAEATVRRTFQLARRAAPCTLFFDELDAMVSGGDGGAEKRVQATFLNEMDGVDVKRSDGVVVVGATNRIGMVPAALLRPGRFDQLVAVPLPHQAARQQIFAVHTRRMAMEGGGSVLAELAARSEGLSGAEIQGVCREAAILALREAGLECRAVGNRHLLQALEAARPARLR
ncbi:unnamed protein product [Chrysoparadoxa australica]